MWDQIRVDHGSEWLLMLYVQEELAQYRTNTLRPPHLQTTSKQVNTSGLMLMSISTHTPHAYRHTIYACTPYIYKCIHMLHMH